MKTRFVRQVAAAVICGMFCLSAGPVPDGRAAGTGGAADARAEALRVAADLRARLEKNAASGPLNQLRQAMAAAPSANALNGYGMALLLADAPASALIVLTEAAAKAPDDFLPFNNLGAVLNNLGQYDRALPLLHYADELFPDNPMVLSNLGTAELGRGRADEAEKLFRRAVEGAPKHPQANYALGMLYLRKGDPPTAEKFLTSSLEGSYTPLAAKALRDVRRAMRRSGPAREKPAEPAPPPVPLQAVEAGGATRIRLPPIEAHSCADCYAACKMLEAEHKRVGELHMALTAEIMKLLPFGPLAQPKAPALEQPAASVTASKVLRLTPDKAERGLQDASLWRSHLKKIQEDFLNSMDGRWKEALQKRGELDNIAAAEEKKCRQLEPGHGREKCLEEVKRRACGRHFQAFDPVAVEVTGAYGQFAPQWESAAQAYFQEVNYWASFLPDEREAAKQRLLARDGILIEYGTVLQHMMFICSSLAPHESCLHGPPAPPPTGELRLEDFKVPCTFRGLNLNLIVASFSVDCTKVTVSGNIGMVAGELEWNFVEKRGTFFIGVGPSSEVGSILSYESGAKAGLLFSMEGDSLSDIAVVLKADVGLKVGTSGESFNLASESVEMRIGLNSEPGFY